MKMSKKVTVPVDENVILMDIPHDEPNAGQVAHDGGDLRSHLQETKMAYQVT